MGKKAKIKLKPGKAKIKLKGGTDGLPLDAVQLQQLLVFALASAAQGSGQRALGPKVELLERPALPEPSAELALPEPSAE